MDFEWQGDGPEFVIPAHGGPWRLRPDAAWPGLWRSDGGSWDRLLGLTHLAAPGRRDEEAFEGGSLIACERYRGRVRATYAPRAWPGLNVRAAWMPTPDRAGFDLEVQVWVTSAQVLRRVEVAVVSAWAESGEPSTPDYRVEPRDARAAGLSYDGREPSDVLQALTTGPVPATVPHPLAPIVRRESGGIRSYIEMVQPNDCARRILGEAAPGGAADRPVVSVRYGLLGHDLEKGVVLRGRIRGLWVESETPEAEARRRQDAFLGEPPALGP